MYSNRSLFLDYGVGTTNGDSLTEETTEANEAAEVTPPPPPLPLSTEQELVLVSVHDV